MDFYKHEDYSECDRLDVKEIQVLQMLKDGNYEIEPYMYVGGVQLYGEAEPGFNRVKVCFAVDEECPDGKPLVGLKVSVADGDVVLEYDPSTEDWTSDDLGETLGLLKEPFLEWIEYEIDVTEYQDDETIANTAVSESAFDLLPEYPCYEVDGELYFYVDPDEASCEIDEEAQDEIDDMMSCATELNREDAIRMLMGGDYEFVDIDDMDEELDEFSEPNEVTKEDVLECIMNSDCPLTARDIAKMLDGDKRKVNQILYYDLTGRVNKSETSVPYWSMKPLEEQVVSCLSDEGVTAMEIAEELNIDKSLVNSVLYNLEGTKAYHDDNTRPNWYLKESEEYSYQKLLP